MAERGIRTLGAHGCGAAWKKDPADGVIGVHSGPLRHRVPECSRDRQMVDILRAILTDSLAAVEAACAEALTEGVYSADVVLNILAQLPFIIARWIVTAYREIQAVKSGH
jgi:hypothetical protein